MTNSGPLGQGGGQQGGCNTTFTIVRRFCGQMLSNALFISTIAHCKWLGHLLDRF